MKTYFLLLLAFVALAFATAPLYSADPTGDDLPRFQDILLCGQAPVNGTNEIQTITIGGTPTAGTFTLAFKGRTTAAITWSATNATLVSNIDTALEALPTIGTSGVTTAVGTMTSGIGTITVTFIANNAKLDVALMTGVSSLTGTSPTLAVATTTAGVTADGRSQARMGTALVDSTNGNLYINQSSTLLQPSWKLCLTSAADGSALTGLTKTQVGLANVDNTSDASKPVSTATQTALDLKANAAAPVFTGVPTSSGASGTVWNDMGTLKLSP